MLGRRQILELIPHQGASCVLDRVVRWSASGIVCSATSHLDPTNPLRRAGRLGAICGTEYGLQAAAVHSVLIAEKTRRAGYLVSLRDVEVNTERLDDAALGELVIEARLLHQDASALSYNFRLLSGAGNCLLAARAVIALANE